MNDRWFCKTCGYGRARGVFSKKSNQECKKHPLGGTAGGPTEWIRWYPQQDATLDTFMTRPSDAAQSEPSPPPVIRVGNKEDFVTVYR